MEPTLIRYFDSHADAVAAARKRNSTLDSGLVTKVERSPYGGYKLVIESLDMVIDRFGAGAITPSSYLSANLGRRKNWV
jgi:hypothetical protein